MLVVVWLSCWSLAAVGGPLVLLDDGAEVLGWMPKGNAEEVVVEVSGRREKVLVKDGVFRWAYDLKMPTEMKVTWGEGHSRTMQVQPRQETGPVALVLVDRPACRPGRKVSFSAFLREKADGGYRVLPGEDVKVEIRSTKKNTLIHAVELRSDRVGRIEGDYTFGAGDALDEYEIRVVGYAGSATVKLADFRKSKVKVDIQSKVQGQRVRLKVAALDFLGKPVPVLSGQVTVDVVRQVTPDAGNLDPAEFAHAVEHDPNAARLTISPDEQLLLEAGENVTPGFVGDTLFSTSRQLTFDAEGRGELDVNLRPEWLDAGDVRVTAVLVDRNGREQRGSKKLVLSDRSDLRLEVSSSRSTRSTGQRVVARISELDPGQGAVLIVDRLQVSEPAPSPMSSYGYYPWHYQMNASIRVFPWYGNMHTTGGTITRTIETAVPFVGGTAHFQAPAGAYRLTAVITDPDGKEERVHSSVIVREQTEETHLQMPVLYDERSSPHGQPAPGLSEVLSVTQMKGAVEDPKPILGNEVLPGSRLKGGVRIENPEGVDHVLVVLRDGKGFRWVESVAREDEDSVGFEVEVPEDCGYGAVLSIYGGGAAVHRELRIPQRHREVEVALGVPETVDAGEEVTVSIDVGAKEVSEVVVSVFDQSLLGIAEDKTPDPLSFLFADVRALDALARDEFRRRLNRITLREIQEASKREPQKEISIPPVGLQAYDGLGQHFNLVMLNAAFQHFGIEGVLLSPSVLNGQVRIENVDQPLGDALLSTVIMGVNRVSFSLVGGTVVMDAEVPRHNLGWANQMYWGRGRYARGDARFSQDHLASANSMVSAQSFVSHIPGGGMGSMELGGGGAGVLRRDFSDSAFFSDKVQTDENGRARVTFTLPDSLTNWQVVATAFTPSMKVGRTQATFKTYRPVMVWPMLPLSFTEGDVVRVFAVVHNRTDAAQRMRVELEVRNGTVEDAVRSVDVAANSSERVYWEFRPGERGFTELLMSADCPAGADASLKRLPVVPCQVETVIPVSGFAKGGHTLKIPKEVDLETARLEVTLAPSLLADMTDTLPYLMQYPHGCVEQTMSRFLPVLKVCQILEMFEIESPDLQQKMPEYVNAGIKRLLSLQKEDGGWGWQGNGATHEMMTPYALYGLLEAERAGYPSGNEEAIERGLDRLRQFIDNMGDRQRADRMYCLYVYSRKRALEPQYWDWIHRQAKSRELSDYATALALEMAVTGDRGREMVDALAKRLHAQVSEGRGTASWKTAGFSRWGDDRIEITAAALKALVAYDVEDPIIPRVLNYFSSTKRGNRWNSTKDTAMVLYALSDYYAKAGQPERRGGAAQVTVNGKRVQRVELDGFQSRRMSLPTEGLRIGKNKVEFEGAPEGTLFRLALRSVRSGNTLEAVDHGLQVTRTLYLVNPHTRQTMRELKDGDTVPPGSYVYMQVRVRHDDGNMRYTLVRGPKPSGCQIVPENDRRFEEWIRSNAQLREDKSDRVLWHYEETASDVWSQAVFFCELEGEFVIPPASAELMYKPDTLGSSAAMRLTIRAE